MNREQIAKLIVSATGDIMAAEQILAYKRQTKKRKKQKGKERKQSQKSYKQNKSQRKKQMKKYYKKNKKKLKSSNVDIAQSIMNISRALLAD